jgi:hypothetical protein
MHKCRFGQAHYIDLLKRILNKFILHFSEFYFISYEFWNLKRISGIYIEKGNQERKNRCTVSGRIQPTTFGLEAIAACSGPQRLTRACVRHMWSMRTWPLQSATTHLWLQRGEVDGSSTRRRRRNGWTKSLGHRLTGAADQ